MSEIPSFVLNAIKRPHVLHNDGVFWPGDVAWFSQPGRRGWVTSDTVKKHLRRHGLAEPGGLRDGYWRLTDKGRELAGLPPIKKIG